MEWIESEGGHLVLMDRESMRGWQGVDGSADPRFSSDYERACAVDDYCAVLNVGGHEVLVLGDEPYSTTFYVHELHGLMLVRWRWADSEASAIQVLLQSHDRFDINQLVRMDVRIGELVLFDAALPGDEVEQKLVVSVAPGRYEMGTALLEPDRETSLLVHGMVRF